MGAPACRDDISSQADGPLPQLGKSETDGECTTTAETTTVTAKTLGAPAGYLDVGASTQPATAGTQVATAGTPVSTVEGPVATAGIQDVSVGKAMPAADDSAALAAVEVSKGGFGSPLADNCQTDDVSPPPLPPPPPPILPTNYLLSLEATEHYSIVPGSNGQHAQICGLFLQGKMSQQERLVRDGIIAINSPPTFFFLPL